MRLLFVTLFAALLVNTAWAHSPDQHKGQPVEATIVEVRGRDLIVDTEKGKLVVRRANTAELFREKKKISFQELQVEMDVILFGTRMPGRMFDPELIVAKSS